MIQLSRRDLISGLAVATIGGLVACKPRRSAVLRFTVRTGIEATGLRIVAQQFTRETGIAVEINELGRDGYMSTVPTQLISGASDADVLLLPSTMIPELAVAGAVKDLAGIVDTRSPDLVATYGYRGRTYAVPSDISSMFLFYRKDLVPKPPETWEELVEVAKRLTRSQSASSPTRYGLAFSGAPGEDLPKTFYNLLWSCGGDIVRGGAVTLDSPEGIAAATLFRSFVDAGITPPDLTTWGFSQVYEALTNGTCAMVAPFWNATTTLLAEGKTELGSRIGYAPIPTARRLDGSRGRVPFQHAWTLVLNARSGNVDNAAAFIRYVISLKGAKLYAEKGGGNPALYSILNDPGLAAGRPDFALLSQSLKLSRAEPAIPRYAAMHAVMNETLTKLLTGSLAPAAAMAEAASRLRPIIA